MWRTCAAPRCARDLRVDQLIIGPRARTVRLLLRAYRDMASDGELSTAVLAAYDAKATQSVDAEAAERVARLSGYSAEDLKGAGELSGLSCGNPIAIAALKPVRLQAAWTCSDGAGGDCGGPRLGRRLRRAAGGAQGRADRLRDRARCVAQHARARSRQRPASRAQPAARRLRLRQSDRGPPAPDGERRRHDQQLRNQLAQQRAQGGLVSRASSLSARRRPAGDLGHPGAAADAGRRTQELRRACGLHRRRNHGRGAANAAD